MELLRSHQGIRFTPAGEAVLAHSRAAAREMEQMRRNLDALQGIICGTLNAGFCVDSITACVEMVKRGLGWGIVPEIGLNGFDGCVRPCIFENGEPFVRKTYLMCQKGALALPQVNAFVELLKKYR